MRFASILFPLCLPTSCLKKRNDPSFGLFNCLEKVRTLNLPLKGLFFSPVFPLRWANLEHIGASALEYK